MCLTSSQGQTLETQKTIKSQFEQLHQVLYREESLRLAALKKEEEEKVAGMKEKIREIAAEVMCLSETIAVIKEQLKENDMDLLKVCFAQFLRCFHIDFKKDFLPF